MNYQGMLIHRLRLERGWSQEGLCKGICAVSYLSKIEQGKAVPSWDVLRMLMERLDLEVDENTSEKAAKLAAEAYELLFSGDFLAFRALLPQMKDKKYKAAEAGPDLFLLTQAAEAESQPMEEVLESCMNSRQLALQRIYQARYEEAIHLLPNAYTYYCAGVAAYERGSNYSAAQEYLQRCYELAAKEGTPHMMLQAKLFLGSCYCNLLDLENMQAHYKIAARLAKALGEQDAIGFIAYNTASTQIEVGEYEEAYRYFKAVEEPGMMSLHKLAVCCEKLGRVQEALEALDKAERMESEYPDTELAKNMCALVRYRLEHPDYPEQEEYGEMLLDCFGKCRKELPIGYAGFHLPWVLEWYTANRQYKKAYELIMDFPLKYNFKMN